MATIEITRQGNQVHIKDVSLPASHQKLDISAPAGTFTMELSSITDGADPNDTLAIKSIEHGNIGNFRASEFEAPAGSDFTVLRPIIATLIN